MASDKCFADFICEQLRNAGEISSRRMFGEYAIYCAGKVVALICDNQFFVKPTAAGKAFLGSPTESPPYRGAKPYYLIDEGLDDSHWLSSLIEATARELPAPKAKMPKSKKVKRNQKRGS